MLNLEAISGLPLTMAETGTLLFGPEVVVDETKTRLLDELTPVALDQAVCRQSQDIAYYMYNGIYRNRDATRLANLPMRYELTLIPPRQIGREFIKTFGHIHNTEPKSGQTYAEVCEVLLGQAHFVFQTLDPAGPEANQAFYVEVNPGQKIIIPPGFDHLTINPGPEPLLFSDVISLEVYGVYDRFRSSRGAAYLEVNGEEGQAKFMPNPHYRAVAPLQALALNDYPQHHLSHHEPLYPAFVQHAGQWEFLTDPKRFWLDFPDLKELFAGPTS
jgi:glucose-6-phosphate isomerase